MKPRIFKNMDKYPDIDDPIYLIWDLEERKRISCFKKIEEAYQALKYWKENENGKKEQKN